MDAAPHQIARGRINHAVAGDRIFAIKGLGNNQQIVVAAFLCAGMSGVAMRFVFNDQCQGLQTGQSFAQQFNGFGTHAGSTFLKGLTVTRA